MSHCESYFKIQSYWHGKRGVVEPTVLQKNISVIAVSEEVSFTPLVQQQPKKMQHQFFLRFPRLSCNESNNQTTNIFMDLKHWNFLVRWIDRTVS